MSEPTVTVHGPVVVGADGVPRALDVTVPPPAPPLPNDDGPTDQSGTVESPGR